MNCFFVHKDVYRERVKVFSEGGQVLRDLPVIEKKMSSGFIGMGKI